MNEALEKYYKNTVSLVKSVIIKSLDSAITINNRLISLYGKPVVDLTDQTTWKYFLNLNGEYYSGKINNVVVVQDAPMTVVSLDTLATISFDKTTLASHPTTLQKYRWDYSFVQTLVDRYPDNELLIKGIINPISTVVSIAAKDMSIMHYNPTLVEPQEFDLMHELNERIGRRHNRWFVPAYTYIDNLYLPSYLAQVYLFMVTDVMNIRISKALTAQANSFHIEEHLRSNSASGLMLSNLSPSLKLWFYKNINYIEHNVGTNGIFNSLILKVFKAEAISINKYNIRQVDTTNLKNLYGSPDITVDKIDLVSGSASGLIDKNDTLQQVLWNETIDSDLGGLNGRSLVENYYSDIERKISINSSSKEATKILETTNNSIGSIAPVPKEEVTLNNWFSLVASGVYRQDIYFKDPVSNKTYELTQQEAVMLYVYYISKSIGVLAPVTGTWTVNMVPRYNLTSGDLDRGVGKSLSAHVPLAELLAMLPAKQLPLSVSEFTAYIDTIYRIYLREWIVVATQNDYKNVAFLKDTLDYMYKREYLNISNSAAGTLITDWFLAKNIIIDVLPNHNYSVSIGALLQDAIGYDTTAKDSLKRLINSSVAYFGRLTSYSIKVLGNTFLTPMYKTNNNSIRITKSPLRQELMPRLTDNLNNSKLVFYDEIINRQYLAATGILIEPAGTFSTTIGASGYSPDLTAIAEDDRPVLLSELTKAANIIV